MTRIAMCALLICGFGPIAVADEAEQFLNYYSWWEGSWDLTMKQGGEVTEGQFEITRHAPNCHLVAGNGAISLWGYDPKRKKWVGTGHDSDGSFTTFVMERHKGEKIKPGVENHAKATSKKPDGTVVAIDEVWSYIDDDTAKTVGTTEDGKVVYEYTCKRRK